MVSRVMYTLNFLEIYNSTVIVCNTEKYKSAIGVQLSTSDELTQLFVVLKPVLIEGS